MKQDYNKSDFGFGAVVGNDFTSYPFNAMKYDYNASIPNLTGSNGLTIDSEIINNSLIDCDHIQRIKKDIKLLANDTNIFPVMRAKAFIDRKNYQLITIGFDPEMAKEQVQKLGLETWGWISESNDRAIPDAWEEIELDLSTNNL